MMKSSINIYKFTQFSYLLQVNDHTEYYETL